jgi:dTDP-4-amino-4,6-dideoxygalactose transaminase
MIPVTKSFLPPREMYDKYLDGIWQRNWLTNHGPLVNELELRLKDYLQLPHILYLNNGTTALQIAIKALDLKGEIITTPFSYVATTSSIVWENCKPVFVDIDANTFNIDPAKIEAAITPQTSAILATHVFGNPCDVVAIQLIAEKFNLKVIYDGAHAFGVKVNGKSIFTYGDVSTVSFHATKLFHTIEGGAVFTMKPKLLKKLAYLRNFGHETAETFGDIGINGKNSEFHAAMGLCNLNFIDDILAKRKEVHSYYNDILKGLHVQHQVLADNADHNYSYYPVLFQTKQHREDSIAELNKYMIFPRRYFSPSLDTLHYVSEQDCPLSRSISERVLCLPIYYTLAKEEVDMIARLLLRIQNN